MNFKDFFLPSSNFYEQIIPTGHTFEGQCTARFKNVDTAIGGSSNDICIEALPGGAPMSLV